MINNSSGVPNKFIQPIHLYAFFFLNLILPVSQNGFRIGFYAIFAILSVAYVLITKRFFYTRWSLSASILSICTGAIWLFYGLLNNNPGAIFSVAIYLVWPIFYILFSGQITDERVVVTLHKLITFFALFLGVFVINFALIEVGIFENNLLNTINLGQAIVFYEGYSEMRLYPLSTLVFVVPYLIAYFISTYSASNLWSRTYIIVCITLAMVVVILAGRRALMINAVLAPLILFALSIAGSAALRRKILQDAKRLVVFMPFFIILLLAAPYLLKIDLSGMIGYLREAFEPSQAWEARVRVEQIQSLLEGWMQSPLIGHGLGSTTGYTRSDRPWEYEIQYVMLLFQIGLLGLFLYVVVTASVYYHGVKISSDSSSKVRPILLSSLVGLSSFLIANASNPYLQAFGHLWVLFLPIGLINLMYLTRRKPGEYDRER